MQKINQTTFISLTHSVIGGTIRVRVLGIGGMIYVPKEKNTHVITIAGIVPVNESVEEIENLLTTLEKEN